MAQSALMTMMTRIMQMPVARVSLNQQGQGNTSLVTSENANADNALDFTAILDALRHQPSVAVTDRSPTAQPPDLLSLEHIESSAALEQLLQQFLSVMPELTGYGTLPEGIMPSNTTLQQQHVPSDHNTVQWQESHIVAISELHTMLLSDNEIPENLETLLHQFIASYTDKHIDTDNLPVTMTPFQPVQSEEVPVTSNEIVNDEYVTPVIESPIPARLTPASSAIASQTQTPLSPFISNIRTALQAQTTTQTQALPQPPRPNTYGALGHSDAPSILPKNIAFSADALSPSIRQNNIEIPLKQIASFTTSQHHGTPDITAQPSSSHTIDSGLQFNAPTTRAAKPAYTSPAQQLSVHIAQSRTDGQGRVTIQLYPVELGKVEIDMHIDLDGNAVMRVIAESRETYELLRADRSTLEKALEDSGLTMDSNDLEFSHRESASEDQEDASLPYQADVQQADKALTDQESTQHSLHWITSTGINIRV